MSAIQSNKLVLIVIGAVIGGLLLGWLIFGGNEHAVTSSTLNREDHVHSDETVWTCSMHPQIRAQEAGKCPICGMDLIPMTDQSSTDVSLVHMSENAMKLANVETAVVGYDDPVKEMRVTGKVKADERKVYSQPTHIAGRIEKLTVNFTGEQVRRGQTLATVYSPEIINAQQELRQAYKIRETQPALYAAAREKLKNWRLSEKQIDDLLSGERQSVTIPVFSDVSGVVINKRVNLGDYVERGMPLYDIADLSQVWVLLDVYESNLRWIKTGDQVVFTVPSLPGESFEGKITFIDPVIDPETRTASARVEYRNRDNKLKPEMLVTAYIKSTMESSGDALVVPKSAVMWTGERSIVYVKEKTSQGLAFSLQEVVLGPEAAGGYVIREGLSAGDEIVVRGTFAVDAAAQLAGQPSMMNRSESHPHMNSHAPVGQQIGEEDRKALNELLEDYIALKNSLVADNFRAASDHLQKLSEQVNKTDPSVLGDVNHRRVHQVINDMIKADNIEAVRKLFMPLSEIFIEKTRRAGSLGRPYYVQHCPMANADKGADWLSEEPEIRNPYFGSQMLSCGEVTAQIK